ncbi:hypothetical protein [Ligilactobacillus equi]|uniref:Uncharacterized protein n=1 Tax=Ligilactobacillus equi DSM 15833 = JCM 10991 TaxID=1423740 RepID=A0A0R1TF29_9LACO|nr:hypothetical protein [Ligilactobacillus equi]KRL79734.1 hypothetical protein FC36_GL000363 [Ligilactobacillus equi DSM 15833 = JCM 10991]
MLVENKTYTVTPITANLGNVTLEQDEKITITKVANSKVSFQRQNGKEYTVQKMALEFILE